MNSAAEDFAAWAQSGWPADWKASPIATNALSALGVDIRARKAVSIPTVRGGEVWWISIAPTLRELKLYMADLSAWVPTNLCADGEIRPTIFRTAPASSPVAQWISELAPEGYSRWTSPLGCAEAIFDRLTKMGLFLASRPEVKERRAPSLAALRMEFVTALRVGDWAAAEQCISEIDQWGLDQAANTLQMRLRLLDAKGDEQGVLALARRHRAWDFPNPRRIASAILRAVYGQEVAPLAASAGFSEALTLYRLKWHSQLHQSVADTQGDDTACGLLAYSATVDRDSRTLHSLRHLLPADLGDFLCDQLPRPETEVCPPSENASPAMVTVCDRPTSGATVWDDLLRLVSSEDVEGTRALLALVGAGAIDDPVVIAAAPDAVLDLLSSPDIGNSRVSRTLQQETIAALIDAYLSVPDFPRRSHVEVYQSLLEGLVALNGESASDADSQLVLGLVAAVTNLTADACARCEDVIRGWWRRRPIVERLNWLVGSLEVLAPLHGASERLADLFSDGLSLAKRKGRLLSVGEAAAWRRVGRMIELRADVIESYVVPLCEDREQTFDHLADLGLKRIAIVSLAEAGAKEAARELEQRTGAEVSVVTALVAGRETQHATSADLILYVWTASTHATFRAFDNSRDRVAYVQGTGSASIVLAAERWAEKGQMASAE
jgi:hypothetical protein